MTVPAILVVDDDRDFQRDIRDKTAKLPGIRLVQAATLLEALGAIREHFLSIAFVDMYLVNDRDGAGLRVIRELQDLRPTCRIVFMTEAPGDALIETYDLLNPIRKRGVDALLSKGSSSPASGTIAQVAKELQASHMRIGNLDMVRTAIAKKLDRWRRWQDERREGYYVTNVWPELTGEEIAYLVSCILRADAHAGVDRDEVEGIELVEQGGGKSSSAVFKGKPQTQSGHPGNLCIFKFGPRPEIDAEHRNYDKFVRFYRGTYRRVESLGYGDGDTIGAMCYAFAGPSPDGSGVVSVQQCIEAEDPQAMVYIDSQLNPNRKEWYSQEAGLDNVLTEFFEQYYHVNGEKIARDIRRMVNMEHGLRDRVGGHVVDVFAAPDWMIPMGACERRVLLPAPRDFNRINTLVPHPRSCIVHGDLNAGNILVAVDDLAVAAAKGHVGGGTARVILIDYRHTRRGPIFIDFAALEASVRLSETVLGPYSAGTPLADIVSDEETEKAIWSAAWSSPNDGETSAPENWSYWATMSYGIIKLARGNFEHGSAGGTTRECECEYAATCVMYILRLLRIRELAEPHTDAARMKLICWMSHLLKVLRAPET